MAGPETGWRAPSAWRAKVPPQSGQQSPFSLLGPRTSSKSAKTPPPETAHMYRCRAHASQQRQETCFPSRTRLPVKNRNPTTRGSIHKRRVLSQTHLEIRESFLGCFEGVLRGLGLIWSWPLPPPDLRSTRASKADTQTTTPDTKQSKNLKTGGEGDGRGGRDRSHS